ncbi:alanine racemase [Sphingomonas flavalba]|uniref:alanine racemase n=1 Tax=Sphingomonas flavalba TaxID=2559804 RepID=UPI0039DFEA90
MLALGDGDLAAMAGGCLTISLDALRANYRLIAARVAPARAAAVVKADGYGLGALRVAPALAAEGCRAFFVAHLSEAIAVKPSLPPDASLFVLNGLTPGSEPACIAVGATPVLNSYDQALRWQQAAAAAGTPLAAVVQVDSGMSRLGMSLAEAGALAGDAEFRAAVPVVLLMSHLACADTPDNPANEAQRNRFAAAAALFPGVPLSLANSGGSFLPAGFHLALVRPGVSLYGGAPNNAAPNPMRPVVALDARVIQIRTIPPGAGVGYGLTFTADRETRIATIAAGYADGLPRALGNRGAAYYNGVRLPIAGRVSMDSITLDVTALPPDTLQPGALVELIGPHQSLDQLAADAGTISYEILTSLGHRYHRIYRDSEPSAASGAA